MSFLSSIGSALTGIANGATGSLFGSVGLPDPITLSTSGAFIQPSTAFTNGPGGSSSGGGSLLSSAGSPQQAAPSLLTSSPVDFWDSLFVTATPVATNWGIYIILAIIILLAIFAFLEPGSGSAPQVVPVPV